MKTFEELHDLPDSMQPADVCALVETVLRESSGETRIMTLEKLLILSDRQWHTYTLPPAELQRKLKKWLLDNWAEVSFLRIETVLMLAFYFGLDKEFYKKALDMYEGPDRADFLQDLEKSKGDNINPWWSMEEADEKVMPAGRISMFDKVRIRSTSLTKEKKLAGLMGTVYGATKPSVTEVEVIGEFKDDFAINVHFDSLNKDFWFAYDLLEFIERGKGGTANA